LNWLPEDSKTLCDLFFLTLGDLKLFVFHWPREESFPREQTTSIHQNLTFFLSYFLSKGFWIQLDHLEEETSQMIFKRISSQNFLNEEENQLFLSYEQEH